MQAEDLDLIFQEEIPASLPHEAGKTVLQEPAGLTHTLTLGSSSVTLKRLTFLVSLRVPSPGQWEA